MKTFFWFAVCFVLSGQAYAARLLPSNFQRQAAVEGALKGGALYSVDLPAEVLRDCAPGQPDIRIFAPDGAEVPYSLVRGEYLRKDDQSYSAEITGYQADSREAVLEFRLNGQFSPVSSIELSVEDRDFRKDAELYGSADGKAWSRLATGSLYDFSSQVNLRRTRLALPSSVHRYYRLKLRDTEDPPPQGKTVTLKYDGIDLSVSGGKGKKLKINGVTARTGGQNAVIGVYDEEDFRPEAAGETADNDSYFTISRGLPFDRVEFGIEDAFFVREFTILYSATDAVDSFKRLAAGSIHRFPRGWPDGERAWADISSPGYGYYKFIFLNRNNPPLRVKSVKLKWLRRSLYFIAPEDMAGVMVAYGRPGTVRPVYDVENFINQGNWEKRAPLPLRLGAPVVTEGYSPDAPADRKSRNEKNLLTGILLLVSAGMGFWLYKLLKKAVVPAV